MHLERILVLFLLFPVPAFTQDPVAPSRTHNALIVELVESTPADTQLDHPGIRGTTEVWLEMLRAARHTIDIEQFYVANQPGGALEPVIREVESAAARGVAVRLIAEKKFASIYPETLERLRGTPGVQLRIIDIQAILGSGVQHAKYFIVDGTDLFVGSQNWDWRALTHINEIGLRVRDSLSVDAFVRLFDHDWELAGGATAADAAAHAGTLAAAYPRFVEDVAGRHELTPVFSPRPLLPDGAQWDADAIMALIDEARDSVKLQLLSYGTYAPLEEALLRAAARGVRIGILVSDWSLSRSKQRDLKRLQEAVNITVKFTSIPEHATGFISFARVEHCKYLLADEERAWLGTSNWSPDYFLASRNAGFVLHSRALCALLHGKFAMSWDGPHATTIDPATTYDARIRDGGDGK